MALLKIALFLFICLEGFALTSAFNGGDGLQDVPLAMTENGDICKDCTQIFELLADLFSNADLQKKIMDTIDNMCDHLPGPPGTAKLCKDEVQKILPVAINFITAVVKPAELCKTIGLCSSSYKQGKSSKPCSFCIFLIKTLEDMLPKQRTEAAVIKLLEEICHILPVGYQDQCESVISKFSKTVLDAILSYATPQAICALLHLCDGQEASVVDPCTLTTYSCKDFKTALQCGTVFYCQKFAWKPLNSNTI
ncbi:prosaposin-like isoform X2 [Labrus mixtus]|uniref:prosaposin-like isoform X2 n=1 Tax=Labrus mixtus TaxID=508554 RepID=UPI0029BFFFA0|nr:prosaposin-like isoform X2 [Labrus mixtus]